MSDRDELAKVIHSRICEESLSDCLEYRGKCVKAAEEAAAAGWTKHSAELAKAVRAAKTLGEIIEKQCRDVLDVTGLHHLINEAGDGHWDVVWMRLFEMRDELESLNESTIARERKRSDAWRDQPVEMLELERVASSGDWAWLESSTDRARLLAALDAIQALADKLEASNQCEDREIAEYIRAAITDALGDTE